MIIRADGGPAFPVVTELGVEQGGMSLRDYFAAKAMQGMLANHTAWTNEPRLAAETAYQRADAMLAERVK